MEVFICPFSKVFDLSAWSDHQLKPLEKLQLPNVVLKELKLRGTYTSKILVLYLLMLLVSFIKKLRFVLNLRFPFVCSWIKYYINLKWSDSRVLQILKSIFSNNRFVCLFSAWREVAQSVSRLVWEKVTRIKCCVRLNTLIKVALI